MKNFSQGLFSISEERLVDFGKRWKSFLGWGIALVLLGILAINYSTFTTLVSVITIGFFLLFAAILVIIDAFHFWKGKGGTFFLQLLMGLLYLFVGLSFIFSPMLGSLSLTFLMGTLFVILGVYRIFGSFSFGLPGRGWILFSGFITLLLGILILTGWPSTGLYIIGLFLGIDLLFLGMNYIMLAFALRNR
jgi:uncharacterized membrane protein HdeD (DUF308 family)